MLEQRLARIEMEEAIRIREMNNIMMIGLAQGQGQGLAQGQGQGLAPGAGMTPGAGQIEQQSPVGYHQQPQQAAPRHGNNNDGTHGDDQGGNGVGMGMGSIASPGPYYGNHQPTRSTHTINTHDQYTVLVLPNNTLLSTPYQCTMPPVNPPPHETLSTPTPPYAPPILSQALTISKWLIATIGHKGSHQDKRSHQDQG